LELFRIPDCSETIDHSLKTWWNFNRLLWCVKPCWQTGSFASFTEIIEIGFVSRRSWLFVQGTAMSILRFQSLRMINQQCITILRTFVKFAGPFTRHGFRPMYHSIDFIKLFWGRPRISRNRRLKIFKFCVPLLMNFEGMSTDWNHLWKRLFLFPDSDHGSRMYARGESVRPSNQCGMPATRWEFPSRPERTQKSGDRWYDK
jgi:hypothetical protein